MSVISDVSIVDASTTRSGQRWPSADERAAARARRRLDNPHPRPRPGLRQHRNVVALIELDQDGPTTTPDHGTEILCRMKAIKKAIKDRSGQDVDLSDLVEQMTATRKAEFLNFVNAKLDGPALGQVADFTLPNEVVLTQSDLEYGDRIYGVFERDHQRQKATARAAGFKIEDGCSVYIRLLVQALNPGGLIYGISPAERDLVGDVMFDDGLFEALEFEGRRIFNHNNGDCIVVSVNSCGERTPLFAGWKQLVGKPGLHVVVHGTRIDLDPNTGMWTSYGRTAVPDVKGFITHHEIENFGKFGLPKENTIAVGDGDTDYKMFAEAILAGGRIVIVEIGVEGRADKAFEATVAEVARCRQLESLKHFSIRNTG